MEELLLNLCQGGSRYSMWSCFSQSHVMTMWGRWRVLFRGCAWRNCCWTSVKEAAGTPCCLALVRVTSWRCEGDGVYSIGVVHGGTAVEPPLRRQQVLHVVLLYSVLAMTIWWRYSCHGIFVLMFWFLILLDVMVLVILLFQSLVIFSGLWFLQLLFYLWCPLLDVPLLLM